MDNNPEKKQPERRSVSEVRSEVRAGMGDAFNKKTREAMIEWKTFLRVEPESITQDLVKSWITLHEADYRERATQELSSSEISYLTTFYYSEWERTNDALKGINGEGPVSKTIDYLRQEATKWGDEARSTKKKIDEGGILDVDFLAKVDTMKSQVGVWENIEERLIKAANLFENSPKFEMGK